MFLLNHKLKKNSADKERGRNPLSMARQLQRLSKKLRYFGLLLFMFAWLSFGVETRK